MSSTKLVVTIVGLILLAPVYGFIQGGHILYAVAGTALVTAIVVLALHDVERAQQRQRAG